MNTINFALIVKHLTEYTHRSYNQKYNQFEIKVILYWIINQSIKD